MKTTPLSCHRFRANEVRLMLSLIAYNLGNLWRRLVLPGRIEKWSLTEPAMASSGFVAKAKAEFYVCSTALSNTEGTVLIV